MLVHGEKGGLMKGSLTDEKYVWRILSFLLSEKKQTQYVCDSGEEASEWYRLFHMAEANVVFIRLMKKIQEMNTFTFPEEILLEYEEQKKWRRGAMALLELVSRELQKAGIEFVVIKTLDQYPDMGHDVDILVLEKYSHFHRFSTQVLKGALEKQNLSDLLAGKGSYRIEQFPALEVHCGKLGQVGEHKQFAKDIFKRRVLQSFNGYSCFVPSPEDRILIAVLARMYRHFNIRICDLVNSITIIKSFDIDWEFLREESERMGILPGVQIYLWYLQQIHQRVCDQQLPVGITLDTRSFERKIPITVRKGYFRYPLFGVSSSLFGKKFVSDVLSFNLESAGRLSLVPPIALLTLVTFLLIHQKKWW